MNRKDIPIIVQRKLYAESMGRCMNPTCGKELFINNSELTEKAHIDSYAETEDNSFENLVILCPNCHTGYDKAHLFTRNDLKKWKEQRQKLFDSTFKKRFESFDQLKNVVAPLLRENKTLFENYYLGENRALWEKFQEVIIRNNAELKELLTANLHLLQRYGDVNLSNRDIVSKFVAHVNEFEETRNDSKKIRSILFPKEIESIFGINPDYENVFSSAETIEDLISVLKNKGLFSEIHFGSDNPYIRLINGEAVFLNDQPRFRQILYDNGVLLKTGVRLDPLNFTIKYLNDRHIRYQFAPSSLRSIVMNGQKFVFVYKYCLSEAELRLLCPEPYTYIVNIHNWNGNLCISEEAQRLAESLDVKLLTQEDFFRYVKENN